MNESLIDALKARVKDLNEKDNSQLKIDELERLINKIKDDNNQNIESQLRELIRKIPSSPVEFSERKLWVKSFQGIQKTVEKTYGYILKGSLIGKYLAIGVGLGVAFGPALGAAFGNIGAAIGIGIALGAGIGSYLGTEAEKKAQANGLVY